MKITYLASIPVEPDLNIILRRLGYKKNAQLNDEAKHFLEESIWEGISLCRLKGVMGVIPLAKWKEGSVILETGDEFKSTGLSRILEGSDEAVLFAATAGNEVVNRISFEMNEGDAAKAIIMDAAASQAVDSAVSWIKVFAENKLKGEGKTITKHRYSPGFKDFSLSNQEVFCRLLNLESLGISLTRGYMLVPEKSVTAIAGIKNINNKNYAIINKNN